ncbi:MAG: hypothetical protein WCR55_07405 [Lentisphaerota bacterium]
MSQEEKYLGYLKYSGESVKDGLLDVRKAAEALLGFDEILRYFLLKEDPSLKELDFEIPVRIKKGSWDVLIPDIVDKILSLQGISGLALTTYAISAAKKAATEGFFETGPVKDIKRIFRNTLRSIQWVIRIASHIGTLAKKKFDNVKFQGNNEEIGIPNEAGEYLYVPKKYFDLFIECPEKLFERNAKVIEKERVLEIGVYDGESIEKVSITEQEKFIFYTKSEDEDIVLPELKHSQYVNLEGEITRATESVNTIGFRYKEHTITCKPQSGSIANFKNKIVSQKEDHFFPNVKIIGIVDRTDKNGAFKEKRPQIIFSDIVTMESEDETLSLF